MDDLIKLSGSFRSRIDHAVRKGLFSSDPVFRRFPKGCCGDTCYLLAEHLNLHGIQTIYVCGTFHEQSHAWLVVKDNRIHIPSPEYYSMPTEIKEVLASYGETVSDEPIDISKYHANDLIDGIIIDITADQFGHLPMYVGPMDHFHKQFVFDFAHDYNGLNDHRLATLYAQIMAL